MEATFTTPVFTTHRGVRMPAILYGTAWKKEETASLVHAALKSGFRGIDTACQPKHYDEAGVGEGIVRWRGGVRADLYLQTKFTPLGGHDPKRIPYDPAAPLPQQVERSFAVSLHNLRTDYLDCLVLHSPLDTRERTLEAWRALERIVDAGGARQIGVSNVYSFEDFEALYGAARIKPAVVQNRFHAQTLYDFPIRAFCREHGIAYQSFWTLTANPHILDHEILRGLASARGITSAQLLFRYLTQEGVVPLTGTRSLVHMHEDLGIFDFELSDDERARITRLLEAGI